jgi:uncharacterized membrane protein
MTMIRPEGEPTVNTEYALIVYILYLVAYVVGVTAVVGVIIAHIQVGSAHPVLASHYRFQIRTFWVGLLYLVVGAILTLVMVGFLIWAWWFILSLVRNIKGPIALNEKRPILKPTSWLFGRPARLTRRGAASPFSRAIERLRSALRLRRMRVVRSSDGARACLDRLEPAFDQGAVFEGH